jgi:hypothetical protein
MIFPIGYLNEDILKQIIKNPKQGLEDLQLSIFEKKITMINLS